MNLDLDDPLGDLLSDGSNDSFFGVEPARKVVPKAKEPVGSKMEALFGIAEEKSPAKPNLKPSSPARSLPKRPETAAARGQQQQKPPIDDFKHLETKSNDSLSSELGFDPKKPRKKSSNILDELLGIGGESKTSQLQAKRENPQPSTRATISRQTTASETVSENVNADNPGKDTSSSAAAAARKAGRRQSAVVFSDPLGLFGGPSEKEKEAIKKAQTRTSRKSIAGTGTEWLFNDPEKSAAAPPLTKLKSSPAIQITANSEEAEPASSLDSSRFVVATPTTTTTKPQQQQLMMSESTNTALNNLKQQEFQLMVATQMKTQENVLIEMKNKQQELLKQQEHQFNELLKKQISRQSELEEIIARQQERINSHIQALMASHAQAPYLDNLMLPPPTGKPLSASGGGANDDTTNSNINNANDNPHEKVALEVDVKRLEMEKLRLEDLLSNISDNHEKEIIMIESSYKKRIQLMEENLQSMEQRYRAEIAALEAFYGDKIVAIGDERANVVSNFVAKIAVVEQSHQTFIEKLRQSYDSDLEMLKHHYEEMMQNIRKSKLMEFAIREESSAYGDMLKRASTHLETASGDIQSLHEVLQEKLVVLERDKEVLLSSREKRIEGRRLALTAAVATCGS